MLPNAERCSRPASGRPSRSGSALYTNAWVSSATASISTPSPRALICAISAWASARKASPILDKAAGDSALATTERTPLCLGGSSVSSSSGRTELGSCHGREVDEKVFQSRRPLETCSKRAIIVTFSPGKRTTGANSRSRSSTALALRTDSWLKRSVSNSGMGLLMVSPCGCDAAVYVEDLAVDERGFGA